jgi:hypothetical protein
VARAILRALDWPRREISVGVANPVVVLGFRALPAVFDALVLPLMRLAGLSRRPVEAHDGNVFAPRPAGDATHGGGAGTGSGRQAPRPEREEPAPPSRWRAGTGSAPYGEAVSAGWTRPEVANERACGCLG